MSATPIECNTNPNCHTFCHHFCDQMEKSICYLDYKSLPHPDDQEFSPGQLPILQLGAGGQLLFAPIIRAFMPHRQIKTPTLYDQFPGPGKLGTFRSSNFTK